MAKKPQISPAKKKGRSAWQKFKNRMSLIIFLGFSGAVFYFGWISIHLEQGEKALLFSKTSGFEDSLISAGEFSWRWQGLIPTNLNIYPISQMEMKREISIEGELPSWRIYSAYGGSQEEFIYRCDFEVDYTIEEQHLIDQITGGHWDPQDMETHYQALDNLLGQWIVDRLPREDLIAWANGSYQGQQEITQWIEEYFPYVEIHSLRLTELDFPDYELYAILKDNYLQYIEMRHQAELSALDSLALDQQSQANRLTQLEEYGRLITEYPLLLDLFALENRPEDLF